MNSMIYLHSRVGSYTEEPLIVDQENLHKNLAKTKKNRNKMTLISSVVGIIQKSVVYIMPTSFSWEIN